LGRDLPQRGIRLRATGDLAIATDVVRASVVNQVRSVALTLGGLGLFLAISYRSITLAGILLLPVAATTLIVFGAMGYLAIPLGVATSMFAVLAEGEGVDFSIHIGSRFLELRRDRPPEEAMNETLGSAGRAVRWNAVTLIAGLLVLLFSSLGPIRALGGLLVAGMAISYLMAIVLLPALLVKHGRRGSDVARPRPLGSA
jgi:predicted RND superfamily exporter protein